MENSARSDNGIDLKLKYIKRNIINIVIGIITISLLFALLRDLYSPLIYMYSPWEI
jgi:hypothetical protein